MKATPLKGWGKTGEMVRLQPGTPPQHSPQLQQQPPHMRSLFTNSAYSVLPRAAGLRSTITPAASSAAILESAPPLPPLTIAPTVVSIFLGYPLITKV